MIITPETKEDVVSIIASEFRTFGGGKFTEGNPVSHALRNAEPQFAAGVSVKEVVERCMQLFNEIPELKK